MKTGAQEGFKKFPWFYPGKHHTFYQLHSLHVYTVVPIGTPNILWWKGQIYSLYYKHNGMAQKRMRWCFKETGNIGIVASNLKNGHCSSTNSCMNSPLRHRSVNLEQWSWRIIKNGYNFLEWWFFRLKVVHLSVIVMVWTNTCERNFKILWKKFAVPQQFSPCLYPLLTFYIVIASLSTLYSYSFLFVPVILRGNAFNCPSEWKSPTLE